MSARIEACICGDEIVAIEGEEPLAVAAHNQTREHQDWRMRGGMEALVYGRDLLTLVGLGVSLMRPVVAPSAPRQALAAALASQTVIRAVPGPVPTLRAILTARRPDRTLITEEGAQERHRAYKRDWARRDRARRRAVVAVGGGS